MARFKAGDRVTVHSNSMELTRLDHPLTITHEPCEGDELWYLIDDYGNEWALNSRSSSFLAFAKWQQEAARDEVPF